MRSGEQSANERYFVDDNAPYTRELLRETIHRSNKFLCLSN